MCGRLDEAIPGKLGKVKYQGRFGSIRVMGLGLNKTDVEVSTT